jgi:hypothetical protein
MADQSKNSPVVTGAVAGGGATLVPAVEWALNSTFPGLHVPDSVAILISGALATAVHIVFKWLAARGVAVADPLIPDQPEQTK